MAAATKFGVGRYIQVAVLTWMCFASPCQASDDANSKIGLEQFIAGGNAHHVDVKATAGQFIFLQIQQRGADLTLSIQGPDLKPLPVARIPSAPFGPISIAVVTSLTGTHDIKIECAKDQPGNYVISSVAVREATESDHARADAELLVLSAQEALAQSAPDSRRQALAKYEKAVTFFASIKDQYREGILDNSLGLAYARMGDLRAALPYFDRAEQIFRALADRAQEGNSINNQAGVLDVLGDLTQALVRYRKALKLSQESGNRVGVAIQLNNIGKALSDQAHFQEALDYFRQALSIYENLDQRRAAVTLGNIASAYLGIGDREAARDYLFKAIELLRTRQDGLLAQNLVNLGKVYQLLGKRDQSDQNFLSALAVYRSLSDKRGEAIVLEAQGSSRAFHGDPQAAVVLLNSSAVLFSTVGDRRSEARALTNLALSLVESGSAPQARQPAEKALAGFRHVGDTSGEAQALLALARIHRVAGDLAQARSLALQALDKVEQVRTAAGADQTRASFLATRQDNYQFLIDLLMDMNAPGEALGISERARARSLLEMIAESGNRVEQGVDPALLARQRVLADDINAKGSRLLAAAPASARASALQQEIRALELQDQELQAAIRKANPAYAALVQPEPATAPQIQHQLLDVDTVLLEYSLGEKRSFLWAVTKADGIHAWTLPGRSSIEALAARVYQLITARGVTLPMESSAETRRRIADSDRQLTAAARGLSTAILAPAFTALRGKRIIAVPDGALQRIPFAMLPGESNQPLVASHEVVVLPSASAVAAIRTQLAGRRRATRNLAVFADPVFDRRDARTASASGSVVLSAVNKPIATEARMLDHAAGSAAVSQLNIARLPFTAQEAEQILKAAPDPTNLKAVGFDASRALATSGTLSDYRYLHFATHGFLDTERPSLSALVLSQLDPQLAPLDGFLRVNDIYNTRLSADLVVLSACQTGLGKEVRGEGLMGLTRAFLYAGAPRTIVSLWNVNDRATAELMASLYRGMLRDGKSPSAALRAAQLELRKQKKWESPYFWAAFVQQGEWR